MTQSEPSRGPDAPVADLIDELVNRVQAGESVDVEAAAARFPAHAGLIRRLVPAAEVLAGLSAPSGPGDPAADPGPGPEPLGDFRVVRELGRGGMGVVYEAEQLSLGRRVALKVLPFAATLDPRHLQRFKNEARAAAGLRHDHIVQVYGVGCDRGIHYYAMELIEGRTLAQVIDGLRPAPDRPAGPDATLDFAPAAAAPTAPAAALPTERSGARGRSFYRAAAALVADAADALEYAHGLGIVHRDVKPGNLLLDAAGRVYVGDFGLAKLGTDAGLTMSGDLLGTLRYMSPEQALARHGLVDHRTDVYGLGATLYELLTGRPAVDGADRADILRAIAFEEPVAPRKVDRSIPAELETIARKALEKSPAERYQSAKDLADDLRRWLGDQTIKARPPGLGVRLGKWARRHRPVVWSAVVVLVVSLAVLAVGYTRVAAAYRAESDAREKAVNALEQADEERRRADGEAAVAQGVTEFLQNDLLGQASSWAQGSRGHIPDPNLTVRAALDRAAEKIGERFRDRPRVEAAVRRTIGNTYMKLTLYAEAEPHHRRAVDLYRAALGPDHPTTLGAIRELAYALHWRGKGDEAGALAAAGLEAARRVLGPDHQLTVAFLEQLSFQGKSGEKVALSREVLATRLRAQGPLGAGVMDAIGNLADRLRAEDELTEAEVLARWSREVWLRASGPDSPSTITAVHRVAQTWVRQGRAAEAEPLLRQVVEARRRTLGPSNGDTAHAVQTLADLLTDGARYAEAEPLYREALDVYRKRFEPHTGYVILTRNSLCHVLTEQGTLAEAEALARENLRAGPALPLDLQVLGLVQLGRVLEAAGRAAEAEPVLREAGKAGRKDLPPGHPLVARADALRGGALVALGRAAEAEPLLVAAHAALVRALRTGALRTRRWVEDARDRLAHLYEARGDLERARALRAEHPPDAGPPPEVRAAEFARARDGLYRLFRETCPPAADREGWLARVLATAIDPDLRAPTLAVELARAAVGRAPNDGAIRHTLGAALYQAGDWAGAVEELNKAVELRKGGDGFDYFFLAMAHWQLGARGEARAWYAKAAAWMDANRPADRELRRFRAEAAELLGILAPPPRAK